MFLIMLFAFEGK